MSDSIYKVIEIIGSSESSWEDAAQKAIAKAASSLEELRVAEVVEQDMKIEDGRIIAYRIKLRVSFKFRDD